MVRQFYVSAGSVETNSLEKSPLGLTGRKLSVTEAIRVGADDCSAIIALGPKQEFIWHSIGPNAGRGCPGKIMRAWVFKNTRLPVSIEFQNLEAGATVREIAEWFDISSELIKEILDFTAAGLEASIVADQQ